MNARSGKEGGGYMGMDSFFSLHRAFLGPHF